MNAAAPDRSRVEGGWRALERGGGLVLVVAERLRIVPRPIPEFIAEKDRPFIVTEIRAAAIRALFQNDHLEAGPRQFPGQYAARSPGADDHEVDLFGGPEAGTHADSPS